MSVSRRKIKREEATNQPSNPNNGEAPKTGVETSKAEVQSMLARIAELEKKQNEQEHKLHHYHRDAVVVSQEINLVDKLCTNDPHGHACITYLGKVCNEYPEIPQCIKDFYN